MLKLDLPVRTKRPRSKGLSNLVDNGYGLLELQDKLRLCSEYVDIVKFGWASSLITKNLQDKVALFNEFGVKACPGGMMFELCWWKKEIDSYLDWLEFHGIDLVEISNGSLEVPEKEKRRMIEFFVKKGFTVLSEVGSKDVNKNSSPEEWSEHVQADLKSGAWKVILEGRADASAGVYRADGSLIDNIVEHVLSETEADKLIFEAPHKAHMVWFIKRIGCNVNIGNVPLEEVLNLETLRLGLRGDTVSHFHERRDI